MAARSRSILPVLLLATLGTLLLSGAVEGAEGVSVVGMAWASKPFPALVVSATGALPYREVRPTPGVLVLDFEATVSGTIAPIEEPGAGLKRATLSGIEEGGKLIARLRVEADPLTRLEVTATPSGVEVRLLRDETPAQVGSGVQSGGGVKELTDVLAVSDANGVSVLLTGKGHLEGKPFTLDNPARLVVDLRGVYNRVPRLFHPVDAAGVKKVRISQFATGPEPIVRVVVDLEKQMPFKFETTAQGAILRVGGEPPARTADASVAPVTTPTTEIQEAGVQVAGTVAPTPTQSTALEPVKTAEPTGTSAVRANETNAVPVSPVKITNEPLQTEKTAEQATQQAEPVQTTAPVVPPPAVTTPPPVNQGNPQLTSPPSGAVAEESPWTTTPAAMTEQATPTSSGSGTREVESQEKRWTGEPISLELKDADVKDVLRSFAKITQLNVVVDPDVAGSVTVQLDNVPWDQALDIILRINSLDAVVENNVLRVSKLERLISERESQAKLAVNEEATKPMRTVTKALSYARAGAVKELLATMGFILSTRGQVVVDVRTNQLIIRDAADRIEGILNLIDSLDQASPQVIIEARIVETSRNFSKSLGLTWGFSGSADAQHGTSTGWKFPNTVNSGGSVVLGGVGPAANIGGGAIGLTFSDILDAFNLDFMLSAAESDGLVRVVSSPKVATQNNEKAHIQSGIQLPVQTVSNNTVQVNYIDATLSLDVTPQVTAEGTVMLDIDIKKREPLAGFVVVGGGNVPISTRDAKTKVLVRDGGTTVIAGMYVYTGNDQQDKVPGLSRVPVLGALFRSRSVGDKHDELLIFITPRVVKY